MREGNSSLLYELAKQVGTVVSDGKKGNEPVSENVVAMSVIGSGVESKRRVLSVRNDEDLVLFNGETEVIRIASASCNDPDIESWDLYDCSRLRELVLGSECLQYVKKMKLVGFESLEKVEMGSGCYSKSESGLLEVSGCEKLKCVVIGGGCCVKWSSFVMRDCGVEEVSIGDGCFVSCEKSVFESGCLMRSVRSRSEGLEDAVVREGSVLWR